MKHSLFSQDLDMPIRFFEKFDAELIREEIKSHLKEYPNDTVEHCKDYSKEDIKKYYGTEILNFYQNNAEGVPCKVVTRGSKEFLRPLN